MNYTEDDLNKAIRDEDYELARKIKQSLKSPTQEKDQRIYEKPTRDAEAFEFLMFEELIYRDSKFIKDAIIVDKTFVKCPGCEKLSDYEQLDFQAFKCSKCGLKRLKQGVFLYVWR